MSWVVNFTGFCGNEQIKELVQDRLGTFGPTLDDICVFITDSGADVKKVVQSIGAFHMPCLSHIVNLVAHKFLAHADAIEGEELWSPSESDEESENDTTKCNKTVHTARSFVVRLSKRSKSLDALNAIHVAAGKTPLNLIKPNATRWKMIR